MDEKLKMKWYDKTWFLWVLFIFVPYIGVPFMWIKKKEYSSKKKIILSVIFGLYAIMIISSSFSDTGTQPVDEQGNQTQVSQPADEKGAETDTEDKTPEVVLPKYEVIDNQTYVRDEKECLGYRVVVADGTTEDDMRNIFKEVLKDDTSHLRTVWFYGLESDIETIGAYTVGMLEETTTQEKELNKPIFTETSITGDTLTAMRENADQLASLKTPFEKDVFGIVSENNGELFSIETIETEGSEEVSVIVGVLCENNEDVVNKIIEEVKNTLFNNKTNESIVITFADIDEGEDSDVLVMAGVYHDGNSDITVMSSEYNSAKNNWISSQFSLWDGAHTALEDLIKDNLNDEKSYDHIETTYIDVNSQEMKDTVNGILLDAGYSNRVEIDDLFITTEFSAKNAFGGTVKNTAFGIASYANNSITLVAIE